MATNPYYEAIVVRRTPAPDVGTGPTLEVVDRILSYKNVSWGHELVGDGSGSISCSSDTISDSLKAVFANIAETPCELWIYRNDKVVHAGPIVGIQLQGKRKTVTIQSRGVLYYLRYMYIQHNIDTTSKGQKVLDLVKRLIDQWTKADTGGGNDTYGNFGFRLSHFGKAPDAEYLTSDGRGSDTPCGIKHFRTQKGDYIVRKVDYKSEELKNVKTELDLLARSEDGFDYWIDYNWYVSDNGLLQFGPGSRHYLQVKGGYDESGEQQGRGTDKSSSVAIEARNIKDTRLYSSVSADTIASWVKVVTTSSQGSPKSKAVDDDTLKEQFGKVGMVKRFDNTTDSPSSFANVILEAHSDFQLGLSGSQENTSIFAITGVTPDDFGVGDIISFVYDAGYALIDVKREVYRLWVSVDEGGTERMTMEFT